jgi:hypothetical protein
MVIGSTRSQRTWEYAMVNRHLKGIEEQSEMRDSQDLTLSPPRRTENAVNVSDACTGDP